MEFKEFCKHYKRVCGKHSCRNCPLNEIQVKSSARICLNGCTEYPDEAEKIVSEWAKKHPIVRNIDKFQEVFGDGITQLCKNNAVNGEVDKAIKKWLFKEYQPPRKER